MALPPEKRSSALMLDEYFSVEDENFLKELRANHDPKKMIALAERWKKDPRKWARAQIFEYLDRPLDSPGHQPLLKRLLKHAEAQNDHELMAAFAVAFDRSVRRVVRKHTDFDLETREFTKTEVLRTPRDSMPGNRVEPKRGFFGGSPRRIQVGMLFSVRTRGYLRRRAWRYFRRLARKNPDQYLSTAAFALKRYFNAHLEKGENLLDSRTLMHICFGESDALEFGVSHTNVKPGRSLSELSAKPTFPEIWAGEKATGPLLNLLFDAPSRPVRVWAMQLLRANHVERLAALGAEILRRLLDHEDEDIQQFGAELIGSSAGLDKLTVATWLELLSTQNLAALQTLCDAFSKHVRGERLTLAQCVELACARATPVAKAGATFLKARSFQTAEDRAALTELANAKCSAVAGELAEFALPILGEKSVYDREQISRFLDSVQEPARLAAWKWLLKGGPAYDDAGLWARLVETPFDDLRLRLVDQLQQRAIPGTSADVLTPVWNSVLLAIHRGGRQKSKAVRQIGAAILENPQRAETLVPVLAVAVRSVRPAEARAGLSSLVAAIEKRPDIAAIVKKHIPELNFELEEATA